MRMSVENLDRIRAWAIRNQAAIPDLTLRLVFATDLAKSVIEQEAAPDPQRVIEIGYDISNLMWRIRASVGGHAGGESPGSYAAGTRVILHVMRQGISDTGAIVEYINARAGRSIDAGEVTGHDDELDMPEFGFREIAVERDGKTYSFRDLSDPPCRPSTVRNLASSIGKARNLRRP